jgi:hypothetical protein
MKVSLLDHRKVQGLHNFTPLMPRVYKFGDLIRVHWLYWQVRIYIKGAAL